MSDTLIEPVESARSASPRAGAAAVLCVLGVLLWVLALVTAHSEPRSYAAGSTPPQYVSLTGGQQYSLDTAGGLAAVQKVVDPASLDCTITERDGGATHLSLTAETNTKALHRVATFVAPATGQARVACADIGAVFVDDADGNTDWAGLLRLLASVLLMVGVPLAISVVAARPARAVSDPVAQ